MKNIFYSLMLCMIILFIIMLFLQFNPIVTLTLSIFFSLIIVNIYIIIYLYIFDKDKRYLIPVSFIFTFIPIVNMVVFFDLFATFKEVKYAKKTKTEIKRFIYLDELPIKLDQNFINKFNNFITTISLMDKYEFTSTFFESNGYIVEYIFYDKTKNKNKHIFSIFFNKKGKFNYCELKSDRLKLDTVCLDEALLILERRILNDQMSYL